MLFKKSALALVCLFLLQAAHVSAAQTTLKFATQNAENAFSTVNAITPWIKQIEQDSNGTLKIDLYANQTLAKGPQVWNAIRNGIADMGWITMGMYAGMNPELEVTGMNLTGYKDAMDGTPLLWKVYESFDSVRKPFETNKILALWMQDKATNLLITQKPVRSIADFKGMKIRCTVPYVPWVKALGGIPVVMAMPEVYTGIQKGIIDGLLADWESLEGFRFYDVAKYVTSNIPNGNVVFTIAMNKNAYNRLPAEAKAAIDKHSGLEGSMFMAEHFSHDTIQLKDKCEPFLAEHIVLSDEERALWSEKTAEPLWAEWLKEMQKKNIKNAQAILDMMNGK